MITVTEQPCTHTGVTREHLDQCCADGVDCDRCGSPIAGMTGADLDPRDPWPLCPSCTTEIEQN